MRILLVILLAMAVSCATTGTKNPGIEVKGTAKISESGGIALNVAFDDAMRKLNIARCKFFRTISVCVFPQEDKAEVVLLGKECNPPKIAGR